MPWKETYKMNQRIEFAMRAVGCGNFAALCAEYGISRKTGYKWRERFVAHGLEGMEEESRRPHGHKESLEEAVVCRIVRLKQAHPHWGPRKIRELYGRKHGRGMPSESSFKRVLERAGLTERRRRRRARDGGFQGVVAGTDRRPGGATDGARRIQPDDSGNEMCGQWPHGYGAGMF